jgi:hypothetical protein
MGPGTCYIHSHHFMRPYKAVVKIRAMHLVCIASASRLHLVCIASFGLCYCYCSALLLLCYCSATALLLLCYCSALLLLCYCSALLLLCYSAVFKSTHDPVLCVAKPCAMRRQTLCSASPNQVLWRFSQ